MRRISRGGVRETPAHTPRWKPGSSTVEAGMAETSLIMRATTASRMSEGSVARGFAWLFLLDEPDSAE